MELNHHIYIFENMGMVAISYCMVLHPGPPLLKINPAAICGELISAAKVFQTWIMVCRELAFLGRISGVEKKAALCAGVHRQVLQYVGVCQQVWFKYASMFWFCFAVAILTNFVLYHSNEPWNHLALPWLIGWGQNRKSFPMPWHISPQLNKCFLVWHLSFFQQTPATSVICTIWWCWRYLLQHVTLQWMLICFMTKFPNLTWAWYLECALVLECFKLLWIFPLAILYYVTIHDFVL